MRASSRVCEHACSLDSVACAEDTSCVVCWAAERTAQLCHANGTSHQCVCERCADHLSSREQPCPMCRQPIALVVKRVFR